MENEKRTPGFVSYSKDGNGFRVNIGVRGRIIGRVAKETDAAYLGESWNCYERVKRDRELLLDALRNVQQRQPHDMRCFANNFTEGEKDQNCDCWLAEVRMAILKAEIEG